MHHTKCNIKYERTTIYDAKDLDLVFSMYNLLEYNSNYCDATGSLCFYCKHEATNFNNDIVNTGNFKSFKYTTSSIQLSY